MAFPRGVEDKDPVETREWLDALESVLEFQGTSRANVLLERLSARMTIAIAFQRISERMRRSMNRSPGMRASRVGGIVFR